MSFIGAEAGMPQGNGAIDPERTSLEFAAKCNLGSIVPGATCGGTMELVTHKKLKGDRMMPWGKGTVVTGAKGLVFLAGNTATADDYEPFKKGGGAVGDAAAQWRNILTNIKSDLEELGTSLDHLIRLTFFVKGPFPTGAYWALSTSARTSWTSSLLSIVQNTAATTTLRHQS
jgi:enamine deaminase RidA (YjgF/YER057c/UK114 family)